MNLAVVIGCPGAAGEEGGRELRRGFCAPGLPLATHNIHRAASEFVGRLKALPSPLSFLPLSRIHDCHQALRGLGKCFPFFPIRPVHVGQCTDGEMACPEIVFPNSEKELARTT